MRLATLWIGDRTRLHVQRPEGLVDVALLAPELEPFADVGALLRTEGALTVLTERASRSEPVRAAVRADRARFAPPVLTPEKIACIGMNYAQHAEEGPESLPAAPLLFAKFANALVGHSALVAIPEVTNELDWEGELAVVLGRDGRNIPEAEAMSAVAGYTIINDLTARDVQFADGQWTRGKTMDGFAPIGPYLVTADEIPDPDALHILTRVNGVVRQDERCSEMVHSIPRLISYLSRSMTWRAGDVIATGTPAGVGMGMTPPVYLADGDTVEVTIEPIGTLATRIGERR